MKQLFYAVLTLIVIYFSYDAIISEHKKFNVESKVTEVWRYDTIYTAVKGTVYHPTVEQCGITPFVTATGEDFSKKPINKIRWCAVSRDLLYLKKQRGLATHYAGDGRLTFGDTIWVFSKEEPKVNGWWVVKDLMGTHYINRKGERILQENRIDFLQDHRDKKSLSLACSDIRITTRTLKEKVLGFQLVADENERTINK
jgi:hypothetical protein